MFKLRLTINREWVQRRLFGRVADTVFGAFMLVVALMIAPVGWFHESNIPGFLASFLFMWAFTYFFSALRGTSNQWLDSEIAQLHQIAATGWVVVPDPDWGGYWAFGPDGQREWLDHWVDVEERFLCTS